MNALKVAVFWGRWLVAGEVGVELILLATAAFGAFVHKQLEAKTKDSSLYWEHLSHDALFFAGAFSLVLALTVILLLLLAGTGWVLAALHSHPLKPYFSQTSLWLAAGLVLLLPGLWLATSLLRGGILPR